MSRPDLSPLARALATGLLVLAAGSAQAGANCPAVLQHTQPRLQDEKPVNLCDYGGKVVLVVNTASYCGYTSQYKSLEATAAKYRDRGLVVLGFPSNDFGGQEPGSNADIAAFCENTFSVKFPMFAKSSVAPGAGRSVNPLFAGLQQRSGQVPRWNFHKYLISRSGDQVLGFASAVDPQDPTFVKDLEKLLKAN
ncbi:MAG: glutathione peroxidase [Burkholderiales bacterium PBB5]|nr:MAG: glutathione peroxidase [Burkholderiales bacterium PBB5]